MTCIHTSSELITQTKQVCAERHPLALNMTLPTFAAERRHQQQSTSSYRSVSAADASAQQQTHQLLLVLSTDETDTGMDRQTNGRRDARILYRPLDHALHTMQAVSATVAHGFFQYKSLKNLAPTVLNRLIMNLKSSHKLMTVLIIINQQFLMQLTWRPL